MFGNVNFFKPYFYFKKRYIYIFFYSQRTNTKRIKAIIPSVITAAFQDNPTWFCLFCIPNWSRFCARAHCFCETRRVCNQCTFVGTTCSQLASTPELGWKFYLKFISVFGFFFFLSLLFFLFFVFRFLFFTVAKLNRVSSRFNYAYHATLLLAFRSWNSTLPRENTEPLHSTTVNYNLTFDPVEMVPHQDWDFRGHKYLCIFQRLKEARRTVIIPFLLLFFFFREVFGWYFASEDLTFCCWKEFALNCCDVVLAKLWIPCKVLFSFRLFVRNY